MDNKRKSNQLSPVEIFKDVVILLLLCSAFFLLWEAQLLVGLSNSLSTAQSDLPSEYQLYQVQAEAARPIRMAVITSDGGVFGAQYDDDVVDDIFQLSANLLSEALGSLDTPVAITESQWQTLLSTSPGLYIDMLGNVPLSVMAGWLSGQEEPSLTATPRRLLLTTMDGLVALCYQDENNQFYCSTTQVVDPSRLSALVENYSSDNAYFAFQSESFSQIDPYTLLSSTTPSPSVYIASNPISTTEHRNELLAILGLTDLTDYTYTSTDGLGVVLRNETDTLRISGGGIVTYQAESGFSSFPIAASSTQLTTFDMVERCRSLASTIMIPFSGEARLHLLSVYEEDDHWTVTFGYTLNGSPVQFSDGSDVAQFIITNGEISEFTLRLREYTITDEKTTPLPQLQAAVALESLGFGGQELILSYYDSGLSSVYADWTANDR